MATLKILISKNPNSDKKFSLIQNKKISEFEKFKDLKDTIKNELSKKKSKFDQIITEHDNFVLRYVRDEKSKDYFPPELNDCIFDNPTFEYLKEKLFLNRVEGTTYKFNIEKVDSLPSFKRPKFDEILQSELQKQWKPICDEIKRELKLKQLEKTNNEYSKMKSELTEREKKINEVHENIICNNCFKTNIKGKRFVCSECFNYNLCQVCEKIYYKKQIHDRNHTLIQVNKPLTEDKDNLLNYDCLISSNIKELKLECVDINQIFNLPIEVSNNGGIDLKNCYILPVRYGEDYLICVPMKIDEKFDSNFSCKMDLLIKVPNMDKKNYEGYFRMFTPSGLPFGQVLFIKAFKED